MNIQSCVCVTPWVWRGFYWIQGTLYEIADQTYCQDTVLELCWQHWKWDITQISIREEDNQQCNLSVRLHLYRNIVPYLVIVVWIIIWVVGWVDITFWNNSVKFKGSHNTNQTLPAEGSANTAYLILSSQTKLPNCLQSSLRKYPSGADWWIQVEAEKNSIPWVEDPDSNNENIKWEKFRYLSPCSHS